jgi:hypothetical protein
MVENETWRVHISVDVEIIGLRQMFKLVTLHMETQEERSLKFINIAARKVGEITCNDGHRKMSRTGQAGARSVLQLYTVLPNFAICKLLRDL